MKRIPLSMLHQALQISAVAGVLLAACGPQGGDPERGRALYLQQSLGEAGAPGCVGCHSLEPERVIVGPSHAHVASRAELVVASDNYDGEASSAAEYLRESILKPDAYVVPGFDPGLMYDRYQDVLSEDQIADLVAFLLTLE